MYTRRSKRKCPFGFRNRPKVSLSILRTRQWRHDRMSFEPNLKKIVPFPRTTSVSFRRTILQISSFVAVQPWPHLSYLLQRGREGEGDGWPCNPHNFTVPFRDNPESESTGHRFKRFNIYRILRYRSRFFDRGFQGHPFKDDQTRRTTTIANSSFSRSALSRDQSATGISTIRISPRGGFLARSFHRRSSTIARKWKQQQEHERGEEGVRIGPFSFVAFSFSFSLFRVARSGEISFFSSANSSEISSIINRHSGIDRSSFASFTRLFRSCFILILFSALSIEKWKNRRFGEAFSIVSCASSRCCLVTWITFSREATASRVTNENKPRQPEGRGYVC